MRYTSLPSNIKHPRFPVPVARLARLARLAVDNIYKGQGIGKILLYDALKKIKFISETIGIFGVVVDAKDKKAKAFYEYYGFKEWQDSGLSLFLPSKILSKL